MKKLEDRKGLEPLNAFTTSGSFQDCCITNYAIYPNKMATLEGVEPSTVVRQTTDITVYLQSHFGLPTQIRTGNQLVRSKFAYPVGFRENKVKNLLKQILL